MEIHVKNKYINLKIHQKETRKEIKGHGSTRGEVRQSTWGNSIILFFEMCLILCISNL